MSRVFDIQSALDSICPDAEWFMDGEDYESIVWLSKDIWQPSREDVSIEISRLLSEWEKSEYRRLRSAEYPAIGDQLDALYHAGVFPLEMEAQISAVKEKYPKPTAS